MNLAIWKLGQNEWSESEKTAEAKITPIAGYNGSDVADFEEDECTQLCTTFQ